MRGAEFRAGAFDIKNDGFRTGETLQNGLNHADGAVAGQTQIERIAWQKLFGGKGKRAVIAHLAELSIGIKRFDGIQ